MKKATPPKFQDNSLSEMGWVLFFIFLYVVLNYRHGDNSYFLITDYLNSLLPHGVVLAKGGYFFSSLSGVVQQILNGASRNFFPPEIKSFSSFYYLPIPPWLASALADFLARLLSSWGLLLFLKYLSLPLERWMLIWVSVLFGLFSPISLGLYTGFGLIPLGAWAFLRLKEQEDLRSSLLYLISLTLIPLFNSLPMTTGFLFIAMVVSLFFLGRNIKWPLILGVTLFFLSAVLSDFRLVYLKIFQKTVTDRLAAPAESLKILFSASHIKLVFLDLFQNLNAKVEVGLIYALRGHDEAFHHAYYLIIPSALLVFSALCFQHFYKKNEKYQGLGTLVVGALLTTIVIMLSKRGHFKLVALIFFVCIWGGSYVLKRRGFLLLARLVLISSLGVLITGTFSSFLLGSEKLEQFINALPLMSGMNWTRVFYFDYTFYYLLFAVVMAILVMGWKSLGRLVVLIFLILQTVVVLVNDPMFVANALGAPPRGVAEEISRDLEGGIFKGNLTDASFLWEQIAKKEMPRFKDFFSPELFFCLRQKLGDPKNYRTLALGLLPEVLQYNGFYTLDAYSSLIEQRYKRDFLAMAQPEFSKFKEYPFDVSRKLYLRSFEMFDRCAKEIKDGVFEWETWFLFYQQPCQIHSLDLDLAKIRALAGDLPVFLFSAAPIDTISGLPTQEVGASSNSVYNIHVYKLQAVH